jgi:hypothetical protein
MWFRRHGDFDKILSDLATLMKDYQVSVLSPQRNKASHEGHGDGFVPESKTRSIAWAQCPAF